MVDFSEELPSMKTSRIIVEGSCTKTLAHRAF
jgi:hypothetical protein